MDPNVHYSLKEAASLAGEGPGISGLALRESEPTQTSIASDAVAPDARILKGGRAQADEEAGPSVVRTPSSAQLVSQLVEASTANFKELSGGLGQTPDEGREHARIQAAVSLLALSFLAAEPGIDKKVLEEAVQASLGEAGAPEHRLIAAAYLQRCGMTSDACRIVREFLSTSREAEATAQPLAGTSSTEDPAEAVPFQLSRLTFARSIEGPGQFVPAAPGDIHPGKTILIYGEFKNPRSVEQPAVDGNGGPGYYRSFSAYLRVYASTGEEVDHLEFLSKERGSHTSLRPDELVNFWARYRIPADLASGKYRLVVTARDHVGKSTASAELELSLQRRTRTSSAR